MLATCKTLIIQKLNQYLRCLICQQAINCHKEYLVTKRTKIKGYVIRPLADFRMVFYVDFKFLSERRERESNAIGNKSYLKVSVYYAKLNGTPWFTTLMR